MNRRPEGTFAGPRRARTARNVRRGVLTLLACIVGAALLGVLGPREVTHDHTTANGGTLAVTHASVVRAGMEVSVDIEWTESGSAGAATEWPVEMDHGLLDAFGITEVYPAPAAWSATDSGAVAVFVGTQPPPRVVLHGRVPTSSGPSREKFTLRISDTDVSLPAWVLP